MRDDVETHRYSALRGVVLGTLLTGSVGQMAFAQMALAQEAPPSVTLDQLSVEGAGTGRPATGTIGPRRRPMPAARSGAARGSGSSATGASSTRRSTSPAIPIRWCAISNPRA